MATKTTKKKEAAAKVEVGAASLQLPDGYVTDPRLGTLTLASIEALHKGTDRAKMAAALREAAAAVRQNPDLIPLPEGLTADRLDELADLLEADLALERDLAAVGAKLAEMRRLNVDAAGQATSALLAQAQTSARLNTALLDQLPALVNLSKRGK